GRSRAQETPVAGTTRTGLGGAGAAGRGRCRRCGWPGSNAAADGADQRARLEQALGILAVGGRIRDDAAPAAQPHPPRTEFEGADSDIELQSCYRAAVPHSTGVDLPRRRLQLVDDLHGPDLRSASDRSGREGRANEVTVAGRGAERAAHL